MVRESKSFDAGRRPPFIVRALTALVAVILTLLVCEIALRYLYPQGGQPLIYDFDASLGHRMRAGVDLVQVWDNHENVSRVRTNSLGLRGAEIPRAKAPGEERILVLGDSYAFGYGVGDEDTFAAVLERELNAEPGGRRVVVANAGVSSYGTAQELLRYRELHSIVHPDVTVLTFFIGNDVHDNLCLEYISLRPRHDFPCFAVRDGALVQQSAPVEKKPKKESQGLVAAIRNAIKDSETYALLTTKPKVLLQTSPALVRLLLRLGLDLRPEYVPHVVAGWYLPENAARGWDLTQHLLAELQKEVAADGGRMVLIIIPSRTQVIPDMLALTAMLYPGEAPVDEFLADPDRPQRMLQQFANDHGIAVLDTTPILRANGGGALYYPAIAHWNEKGHKVVADALRELLAREGIVTRQGA